MEGRPGGFITNYYCLLSMCHGVRFYVSPHERPIAYRSGNKNTMFEVPTAARLVTSRSVYPSPARLLLRPFLQFQTWNLSQSYATQTSLGATTRPLGATTRPPQKHKKVTVFNDDGHIRWGDLTIREKVARTTQQSFNFTLIAGGAVMTVGVVNGPCPDQG